ncbi:hypothetical protein ACQBAU_16305 [Propionibacteriaceae bacterium Y2011]
MIETDRIRDARGREWEVDGEVADWRNPFTGWEAGIEIPIRRFKG